jgi:hypothetical protein
MRIRAHGLSIDAPDGWEARIAQTHPNVPILHVANFALRSTDGGFGAGATARMSADHAFAALLEYHVDEHLKPGVGLFATDGWNPRLRGDEFASSQLEAPRRGLVGVQRFFTQNGRPFCLYAVVAPGRKRRERLVEELSGVLRTVRFDLTSDRRPLASRTDRDT